MCVSFLREVQRGVIAIIKATPSAASCLRVLPPSWTGGSGRLCFDVEKMENIWFETEIKDRFAKGEGII